RRSLACSVPRPGAQQVPARLLVLLIRRLRSPEHPRGGGGGTPRHAESHPRDGPFDPLIEFFHDVPQPVIDAAFAEGEPRQSDTIFASPCRFERWPQIPTRVLIGRDDRFFPLEFQRRVARERLGIEPDDMPGGHLVALSRPAELAEQLIAYSAKLE